MTESRGWRSDRFSPSETSLLQAAGLREAGPALAAWRSFRETVNEGSEETGVARLLPLVCRNLLRLGHEKDPYLGRAYAESFGANARILGQAASALQALHDASIPTMVLKGTALLLAHHRDTGVRPMSDVDILVPEARIVQALDVLEAVGWRGDPSRGWLRTESHAGTLTSTSGLTVDLHRYATYEARFASANDAFFADSVRLEVSGAPTSAMSASDQLLHTLVHGLRWSIARSAIWVVDAATILRGGGVDIQKTVARAAHLRWRVALQQGLETVRQVLGGHETLDALLNELRASPSSRSERIEHRFRVSEPAGLLGALPNLWFAHRRSDPDGRPPVSEFPSFLRQAWGFDADRRLARVMLAKTWRRLRSRVL